MNIDQEIKQWDGKSANDIAGIYQCYCHDPLFITEIITCIANESLQQGTTWLMKRYLEDDNKMSKSEIAAVFQKFGAIEHWESKLHLLQSLPFMPIEKSQKKKVEYFLRDCLTDNNKFVRAWAYNGFHQLAIQHPEYVKETKEFFAMAIRDEAPSVKSRIRNIMKKGF